MKIVRNLALFFLLIGCGNGILTAQNTPKEPSFTDMFRQMQEMIQQLSKGDGMSFQFPDMHSADSMGNGFFFKFDTSFMQGEDLFRTMPFRQGDSMYGMGDFFRQFDKMLELPEDIDDGNSRTEEDLLPEERLRQGDEGTDQAPDAEQLKKPKPAPKKSEPTRKTIRI
jgi:hypothetical protein